MIIFKPFHIIPNKTKIQFLNFRFMSIFFSTLLVLISISLGFLGFLNFGIDFKGGILIEARSISGPADIPKLREDLKKFDLGEINIQEFGNVSDVLIRFQKQEGEESLQAERLNQIKKFLNIEYEVRRTEFVGPVVGKELQRTSFWAIMIALLGILVYIWFRFEWQFAIAAILALFHDVVSTIGLYALTNFEFNLSTVAAILTIAGYSINDTVVVFDRIRENLRKYKSDDQINIMNLSLNETLSRTITTSITTLLALLAIYFFGGEVLSNFTLTMIWGVLIGTYSSIFVASAALSFFKIRLIDFEDEKEE